MANNEAGDDSGRPKLKKYEKELRRLQAELCELQNWVKYKGLRAIISLKDAMPPEGAAQSALSPSE